jgi:hypothetical protein
MRHRSFAVIPAGVSNSRRQPKIATAGFRKKVEPRLDAGIQGA